ncbi:MAG: hypothetical protein KF690_09390 [Bacteroidetes bacterium]|nr:hypothetical protein [Bacteroidota bacterium]
MPFLPRIVLLCVCLPLWSRAQEVHTVLVGANVTVAYPMKEMYTHMPSRWGIGFGVHALARPVKRVPLLLGADFNYSIYGRYKETLPPQLADEKLEQVVNNNILMLHAVARISPLDGVFPLRPYIEGLIGSKLFYTRWKLNSTIAGETEVVDSNTDESSVAFSYGMAGGLNVALGKNVCIDLRCAYLRGHSTEYVERVVRDPNGDGIIYHYGKTRTDMLVPQLGMSFTF